MNSTKNWRFGKVIIINILVVALPLAFFEAYFLYDKLEYRSTGITCPSKLTNYDYCPSVTELRWLALSDGWFPVVNHIDENKRSTYKVNQDFPTNGKRVFLIGDSFIQAEELRIEDRFEHALRNEGFDVHAIGYSSWNSRQFNSIVKSLDLRIDDEIIIFSMGNDYTPSYYRSTIKTTLNVTSDGLAATDVRGFWGKIYDNSFSKNTYTRAKSVVDTYFKNIKKGRSTIISSSHDKENWMDCTSLPMVNDVGSTLVHDYLSLSKHEKCWSESIQKSVELNVTLLNEASQIAQSQGANLRIALISAGFAFPQQNTLGRRSPIYNIAENVVVTQAGLSDKLIREGFNLLDLEDLLRVHAGKGVNYLYLPADGHFTKDAHSIIGDYLIEILKQ